MYKHNQRTVLNNSAQGSFSYSQPVRGIYYSFYRVMGQWRWESQYIHKPMVSVHICESARRFTGSNIDSVLVRRCVTSVCRPVEICGWVTVTFHLLNKLLFGVYGSFDGFIHLQQITTTPHTDQPSITISWINRCRKPDLKLDENLCLQNVIAIICRKR
jgi:hypothetical protein